MRLLDVEDLLGHTSTTYTFEHSNEPCLPAQPAQRAAIAGQSFTCYALQLLDQII